MENAFNQCRCVKLYLARGFSEALCVARNLSRNHLGALVQVWKTVLRLVDATKREHLGRDSSVPTAS